MNLTNEQQAVIDALAEGKNVVVEARLGSGKTRTIQAICAAFPSKRILYLTYNKLLKEDAKERIKSSNATVTNFHGFAYGQCMKLGLRPAVNASIEEFNRNGRRLSFYYEIIAIDEWQDIVGEIKDMLLLLKEKMPNAQWCFVGDPLQKIYDRSAIDVMKDCIEKICPEYTLLNFTKCFRVSKEHADYLASIWGKPIVGMNSECKVQETKKMEDLVKICMETPNEKLLILGARYGKMNELVNILEREHKEKFNKETLWTNIRDGENSQIVKGSAISTTYDGCKGLERPVCIVVDYTIDYLQARLKNYGTNSEIIRNVFCVAASRGKDLIVFYNPEESTKLQKDDFVNMWDKPKPFNPSEMFDFKFQEHIDACYEMLEVTEIPQDDHSEIEATMSDYNIDLAPVVGAYQEIAFFKTYDYENVVKDLPQKAIKTYIEKINPKKKRKQALCLAAYNTELARYCNQAREDFIDKDQKEKLLKRLEHHLRRDLETQIPCSLAFPFQATGKIDTICDGTIWELKFKQEVQKEDFLQLAMYMYMERKPGILYNSRFNREYSVQIKDRQEFIKRVQTCIHKGLNGSSTARF